MKAVCADDEILVLRRTTAILEKMPELSEVEGFTSAEDTLEWLRNNTADIAVLDIDMPDQNGIELAMEIKKLHPDIAILFLTGYSKYALDAFSVHATGYLLKPVNAEKLAEEVRYALSSHAPMHVSGHITARTFGEFDLLVDGKTVSFPRAKAKELLAFLIDRQGASVSRTAVFAAMFEDEAYDRSRQKYLDVIIRSLRDTLTENGIQDLLENKKGMLRVRAEMLDCDLYRFFAGDIEAINAYRGEYMNSYTWAVMREAYIDGLKHGI